MLCNTVFGGGGRLWFPCRVDFVSRFRSLHLGLVEARADGIDVILDAAPDRAILVVRLVEMLNQELVAVDTPPPNQTGGPVPLR